MKRITKRDVIVFILGFLTFWLINIITDWQGFKDSFKKGFNEGYNSVRIEIDK